MVGYVHGAKLVVASQEEDLVGKHNLLGKQIRQHFDRVGATIHVVAQEQKTSRSQVHSEWPENVRKGKQVLNVSVKITKHVDGGLQSQQSRLRRQDGLYPLRKRGSRNSFAGTDTRIRR